MRLLKFLLMLPLRLLKVAGRTLAWVGRPLFGNFTWHAPRWMKFVAGLAATRPKSFYGTVAAMLVVIGVGLFGWHWYQNLPVPQHMTFRVFAPKVTHYYEKTGKSPHVYPLVVRFSGSAAPIEQVDKVVKQGIAITPKVKGQWRWTTDHTLRFTPESDWPVGRKYTVQFNRDQVFAAQVRMGKGQFEFHTAAFSARLGQGQFYQSPEKPKVKQVIQELSFNYPADPGKLHDRVRLQIADRHGKPIKPVGFSLTWDKNKTHAWIHSDQLPLLRDPGQLLVTIDDGVSSSRGGGGTSRTLHNSVRIPGLDSLRIDHLDPTIVNGDDNNPRQVLVVHFTGPVQTRDVSQRIQAWVLPKYHSPDRSGDGSPKYHYQWATSQVGEQVLGRSRKLKLTANPTKRPWQELQSFKFKAKPGQRIFVRVDKGMQSFGGYLMGEARDQVVTVPDYPKLLSFVGSGSLLSMSGSQRISIVSRNLPGFKLQIGRVLPGQLEHLASLNTGDYAHPRLPSPFGENQIAERFVKIRTVNDDDPGKKTYTGINLGRYITPGKHGIFWLHLSGYDSKAAERKARKLAERCRKQKALLAKPENGGAKSDSGLQACNENGQSAGDLRRAPHDSRLIVITDLGMIVKTALDGRQDVFVQSIHTGKPMAGARVAVVAINGSTLMSRVTGTDGMVTFPSLEGLKHDKQPVMYLVSKGQDMSFLPIGKHSRQLNFSRFNIGGEANYVNPGKLSAYLFSDRGLYRPGESLHVGMIVRAAEWTQSVAGLPLQADVVGPRGHTVKTYDLTLDGTGFDGLTYDLARTAPTGTWTVNLYITRSGRKQTRLGSTTVMVKQFHAARMKVTAGLSSEASDGWVKPGDLKGEVQADNLFGTPAEHRRVTASIMLQPTYPEFESWPGWHFYDAHRAHSGYEHDLEDGKTNEQGHAEFDLHLDRYKNATYRLYFFTKVYEAGSGRGVAANSHVMVSGNDWLVGYKSKDDLSYVHRGTQRQIKLIAINPQAKSIKLAGLTAKLVQQKYVSVLTKQKSGVYKYESHLEKIPVSSQVLAIPRGGKTLTLDTDKPGNYVLEIVRNSDGQQVNRIAYKVAGEGNVSRSLTHNAQLQISLDKKQYEPGDTIHVSIQSPYTGSGLITIERDKVYAHQWFHTNTTSSVQTITIPDDFKGNGYVNVQFVRDPSSDAIFTSPLSYGVAPFRISHDQHRDKLQVDIPDMVKPGQNVTFKLHTDKPARVVLFAVNEGILQVARYHFRDPLDYFFRKRRLEVQTSQILNLILPEFEKLMRNVSTPGGGKSSEMAAIKRHLNPFSRKHRKPVAYWSGVVQVNGERDFTYKVPDYFNGKLRVMAVAVTPRRIGAWQGTTTVRGDFVLSPSAPHIMAPGDKAIVSVGVANNLTDIGKKSVPIELKLHVGDGLKVVGPAIQSVKLASMREGKVQFQVKATDRPGSANLAFTATYGNHKAQLGTTISVRPATAYRVSIDTKQVGAGDTADYDKLRNLYAPFARRNAVMSSSPVVLARGLTSYLINYPHYCTEQIISAAMPRLIVNHWPAAQAFIPALQPAFHKQPISNSQALSNFINTLQTRQNNAGGFGLWSATPDSLPFISDYAVNFMLEARQRGVKVPQGMIDAGNDYLRQLASDKYLTSLHGLRDRAYAIYLLTRQGHVTTNYIASLQKRLGELYPKRWKDDLTAAWLAASYKLMKQDKAADRLIKGPIEVLERDNPGKDRFRFSHYYGPTTRDASVLYILARQFPKRADDLPPTVFENLAWPLEHQRYNTLSAAMTLLALDAYAGNHVDDLDQMKIEQVVGKTGESGQTGEKQQVSDIGEVVGNILQADGWAVNATRLRFVNPTDRPAWGVVTQSGYDRKAPKEAIKNGLEIVTDYTDEQGQPIQQVTLGQTVYVHLKIRAIDPSSIDDVVIVSLLPGGFDPVLHSHVLGLESSTWRPESSDVREDRVVVYGTATSKVREFVYKLRATSVGTFEIPPVYASSMYNRKIQAEAPSGGELIVVPPKS